MEHQEAKWTANIPIFANVKLIVALTVRIIPTVNQYMRNERNNQCKSRRYERWQLYLVGLENGIPVKSEPCYICKKLIKQAGITSVQALLREANNETI